MKSYQPLALLLGVAGSTLFAAENSVRHDGALAEIERSRDSRVNEHVETLKPLLRQVLNPGLSQSSREAAARELLASANANVGDERAVKFLLTQLDDAGDDYGSQTLESLLVDIARRGDDRVVPELLARLKRPFLQGNRVRRSALNVLGRLKLRLSDPELRQTEKLARAHLQRRDRDVRASARRALTQLTGSDPLHGEPEDVSGAARIALQPFRSDQVHFVAKPGIEAARAASAKLPADPSIESLSLRGADGKEQVIWKKGEPFPTLNVGDVVTIRGRNFGHGPEVDASKLLFMTDDGSRRARVLEKDIRMYEGKVNILTHQYTEKNKQVDEWPADLLGWTEDEIQFRVPVTAAAGRTNLVIDVRKRVGANDSITNPGQPHRLANPLTSRIVGKDFVHETDVISKFGEEHLDQVEVRVNNPDFERDRRAGEEQFWCGSFGVDLAHAVAKADWTPIMHGQAKHPEPGKSADPSALFGAIRITPDMKVPDCVRKGTYFKQYPLRSPIKPILGIAGKPLEGGHVTPTDYVGYVWAESRNPLKLGKKEKWIGFNCASCHAQEIRVEKEPGVFETRVVAGLPTGNRFPKAGEKKGPWSMGWAALGRMAGIRTKSHGKEIDKSLIMTHLPGGTGEFTSAQKSGKNASYGDDGFLSPTAIPPVTSHTAMIRALSMSDDVLGFEGSYAHSQEPDGGLGSMHSQSLKELTAYMSTLSENDKWLRPLGLFRHLQESGKLEKLGLGGMSEGQWNQLATRDENFTAQFPKLASSLTRGKAAFDAQCARCHASALGTGSDENMIPLTEVGSFMSPTKWQRQTQAIRSAMLTNVYWTNRARGWMHDAHVRSLEDLVNPERLNPSSKLYADYYTLKPQSLYAYSIPKGTPAQEAALRQQRYFVDVAWDKKSLYFDYQKMQREFGLAEYPERKLTKPIPLPAAPHPWAARSAEEAEDLVTYLNSL